MCDKCYANKFENELNGFGCTNGEVKLAINESPPELLSLFKSNDPLSIQFKTYARLYNNTFAFSSMGIYNDKSLAKNTNGVYTFRVHVGEDQGSNIGHPIILPPYFIGGPQDMHRRYLDAMTLVQKYGKPDIFLTMTCNPAWPEILQELLPGEKAHDRPDLATRIFHAKLMELKHEIVDNKMFGDVAAYVYVIEFQREV